MTMSRLAFITTAILASRAAAQASHAIDGYEYVGCVKSDSSSFPLAVDFFAPFTPEQCQTACGSRDFAAVGGGCFCSELELKVPEFEIVDESECSNLCIADDESQGYCGGPDGHFNLYQQAEDGGDEEEEEEEEEDEDCEDEYPSTTMTKPGGYGGHGGHGGHGGPHTKTETTMHTVTSCPPEVPDCPLKPKPTCYGDGCGYGDYETETETEAPKPTYTSHKPCYGKGCGGSDGDKYPETPEETETPCYGAGCGGSAGGTGAVVPTPKPTSSPIEVSAAGHNAPMFGVAALGALFFGLL